MYFLLILFSLLFSLESANGQTCRDGLAAQIAEPPRVVFELPVHIQDGKYAYAQDQGWTNWPTFPGDAYLDGLTFTGGSNQGLCWYGGTLIGPMGAAQDESTYYELQCWHYVGEGICNNDTDPNEHRPSGTLLPYHNTAAINPEVSTSGAPLVYEHMRIIGFGDGFSLDEPFVPLGLDIVVRGLWFEYLHDDAFEDDHGRVDYIIDDSLIESAFMLFAMEPGPETRFVSIKNSWVRLVRFKNAYKQRDGHGGLWKFDNDENDKIVENTVFLLGPDAGNQSIFPLPETVVSCLNNVVLWDGTTAMFNDMLGNKNNGGNLDAINNTFNGCFEIVLRETVCPQCVVNEDGGSAAFRAMALPELGGKSWSNGTGEWKASHFPVPTGCGVGFELALILPVFRWLWRRHQLR